MRRSKGEELKAAAGELVTEVFAALKEAGITLDLDQQMTVLSRVREVCERIGANGNGVERTRGGGE